MLILSVSSTMRIWALNRIELPSRWSVCGYTAGGHIVCHDSAGNIAVLFDGEIYFVTLAEITNIARYSNSIHYNGVEWDFSLNHLRQVVMYGDNGTRIPEDGYVHTPLPFRTECGLVTLDGDVTTIVVVYGFSIVLLRIEWGAPTQSTKMN